MKIKKENSLLLAIGKTTSNLNQSIFSREILKKRTGPPPEINLFNEKNNGETLLNLIEKKLILSCHDISLGGLLTSLTEMCMAGNMGAKINTPKSLVNLNEYFFSEDQSRYIIEIEKKNNDKITDLFNKNSVFFEEIGSTQKDYLSLNGEFNISIKELTMLNNNWFKKYTN